MRPDALAVQAAVRDRTPLADQLFDRQYPKAQRYRSEIHWTPVEVAARAAHWLEPSPGGQVLDIGAGVGKACIVGAMTSKLRWYGVERDRVMVRMAKYVARDLGVADRAQFRAGEGEQFDWSPFGGFYLYNPFAEALFMPLGDDEPALVRETYLEEVATVERKLAATRVGTRVVTYHGFGGEMPPELELVEREAIGSDELCLWIRRGPARPISPST